MAEKFSAKLGLNTKEFETKLQGANKSFQGFNRTLSTAAAAIGAVFALRTVTNFAKTAIQNTAAFEKSLASLSAITGAVGNDLVFYSKAAREVGRTSTYSGEQVAKAFELMGSARPELLKNKEALSAVTKEAIVLAQASGLDLETATISLAKAMNQFNIPASEAARVINVLAAGSKEGAEAVPGLAEAITNMGTAANLAGISLEQSVALIETLAEKGLTGARAGIMLRNVILRLQAGADQFNPAVMGLTKSLENLGKANLTSAEMTAMFGLENQQAVSVLVNGRTAVEKFTKAVTGTNVAYEQQETNLDTLSAQWTIFTNNLKDATIASEGFTGALKNSLKAANDFMSGLRGVTQSEDVKWWAKLGVIFNQVMPGGLRMTKKELDALIKSFQNTESAVDIVDDTADSIEEVNNVTQSFAVTLASLNKQLEEQQELYEGLNALDGVALKNQKAKIDELKKYIELVKEAKIYQPGSVSPVAALQSPLIGQIGATTGGGMAGGPDQGPSYMIEEANRALQRQQTIVMDLQGAFANMFMNVDQGWKGMIDSMIQSVKRMLVEMAAWYAALAILNLIAPGSGAAVAAFTGFTKNFGFAPFANGGLAYGPTVGMVGEYAGARSNPEVIAPLDKLKGLMGAQEIRVIVDGEISGRNIKLANRRNGV